MESNMKKDMNIYVLDHNVQIQTMMAGINQEIITELFLDLQNKKS